MNNRNKDWVKALSLLLLLQVEAVVIVISGVWIGEYLANFFVDSPKDTLLTIKATVLLLSLLIVFYLWIKTFLVIFKK